jgi:hypothetical protein
MSGTSLCSAEDALRFGVVPQQVALAARQFVHSEIFATALGVFMFFLSALVLERGGNLGDAVL